MQNLLNSVSILLTKKFTSVDDTVNWTEFDLSLSTYVDKYSGDGLCGGSPPLKENTFISPVPLLGYPELVDNCNRCCILVQVQVLDC